MMEFNDMVTVVDPREMELRELEVLIRLVPFVERDVEERCAELEEEREAMADGIYLKDGDKADELKKKVLEDYERMKEREGERVVRLRRAILERAGRVFPELRITNYELRVKNSAASPQGEGKDFRPVSGGDAGGGSLPEGVETSGFHTPSGGVPTPGREAQ